MAIRKVEVDDESSSGAPLSLLEWKKDVPTVEINTPKTTPSKDIPSSRVTVSTPLVTATMALVIGSEAFPLTL